VFEEVTKNLDEGDRKEAERNSAIGFNNFDAAKEK